MLTNSKDNLTVAEAFNGDAPFYTQDMEDVNVTDALDWLNKGELEAIVSEEHGGIIGYIHRAHAQDVATVLNLHALKK